MTLTGTYPDGTHVGLCADGWALYLAWLAADKDFDADPFDNPEGRAYWDHRDNCPECTKRKESEE